MSLKKFISPFILIVFFGFMLFVQTHLKTMPVLVLMSTTLLVVLLFYFGQEKTASFFLFLLILVFGFCVWFTLSAFLQNAWFPPPPQNPNAYVADYSWMICIPIAGLLSLITAYLYFMKVDRSTRTEMNVLAVYLIAAIFVFTIDALR